MDVKDQAKVSQARDRYREAAEEMRNSYDKNLSDVKETFDGKIAKQSKNYDTQKTKLEEQNAVNNELFSDKTKSVIGRAQEDFKNKLRDKTVSFDKERDLQKNELNDKLTNLSESYKKSSDENNRYQDQIKKTMGERYTSANKNSQDHFNSQIKTLEEKSTQKNLENGQKDREERMSLGKKHNEELEGLRNSSGEEKFKEISRLKNDNENVRTTLGRDNQMLKDRQEERLSDVLKSKDTESGNMQKNFENLQSDLRQKNIASQERENNIHKAESKELSSNFQNNIRNIQRVAEQKIKGGTNADNLNEELKQTTTSYENRLGLARAEVARNSKESSDKENNIDAMYKEKIDFLKTAHSDEASKKEAESNDTIKLAVKENRDKTNSLSERFKSDSDMREKETENRVSQLTTQGKDRVKDQRVEFTRVVNNMNDKNLETMNSLKEDYSKDKTASIEKSKKEFNDEKMSLKNGFSHQSAVRDGLYEQKLAEIEKQTNKIIDNYENRISQIARKAENEVAIVKMTEAERSQADNQANKAAIEDLRAQSYTQLTEQRDRYETKIGRDRAVNENQTNKIVQRYEDLMARDRIDQQKELTTRVAESQAQFERLFKSSEAEKTNIRNQYEQRIENMKLGSLKEDSKKA